MHGRSGAPCIDFARIHSCACTISELALSSSPAHGDFGGMEAPLRQEPACKISFQRSNLLSNSASQRLEICADNPGRPLWLWLMRVCVSYLRHFLGSGSPSGLASGTMWSLLRGRRRSGRGPSSRRTTPTQLSVWMTPRYESESTQVASFDGIFRANSGVRQPCSVFYSIIEANIVA